MILLMAGGALFIYGPLTACFAYLAALLKQQALRSGFWSDIVVLSLTGICSLVVTVFALFYFYAMLFHGGAESQGEAQRQIAERQGDPLNLYRGLDDRTIGILSSAGSIPTVLMLYPLSWAVVQLLWLVTAPFVFLARKFTRRKM